MKVRLLTQVQLPGMPAFADCLTATGLATAGGARRFDDLLDAAGSWHVLRLMGVRAGSAWLALAPERITALPEPEGGAGILETSLPLDVCWAATAKKMRSAIRSARLQLGTRADVSFASGPEIGAAYDEFLALEAAGWKGAAGTALANIPMERELLRAYLSVAPGAEVRTLRIDGQPAASQLTVAMAGSLFLLKLAYDERLARLGPGNLLMANLLETCCADAAIDRIDFLNWQPWLERWGAVREPTYQVVAFNRRSARGAAAGIGWNVVRNPRMQFAYARLRDAYRRPVPAT